jgi:hypothetical protein
MRGFVTLLFHLNCKMGVIMLIYTFVVETATLYCLFTEQCVLSSNYQYLTSLRFSRFVEISNKII